MVAVASVKLEYYLAIEEVRTMKRKEKTTTKVQFDTTTKQVLTNISTKMSLLLYCHVIYLHRNGI